MGQGRNEPNSGRRTDRRPPRRGDVTTALAVAAIVAGAVGWVINSLPSLANHPSTKAEGCFAGITLSVGVVFFVYACWLVASRMRVEAGSLTIVATPSMTFFVASRFGAHLSTPGAFGIACIPALGLLAAFVMTRAVSSETDPPRKPPIQFETVPKGAEPPQQVQIRIRRSASSTNRRFTFRWAVVTGALLAGLMTGTILVNLQNVHRVWAVVRVETPHHSGIEKLGGGLPPTTTTSTSTTTTSTSTTTVPQTTTTLAPWQPCDPKLYLPLKGLDAERAEAALEFYGGPTVACPDGKPVKVGDLLVFPLPGALRLIVAPTIISDTEIESPVQRIPGSASESLGVPPVGAAVVFPEVYERLEQPDLKAAFESGSLFPLDRALCGTSGDAVMLVDVYKPNHVVGMLLRNSLALSAHYFLIRGGMLRSWIHEAAGAAPAYAVDEETPSGSQTFYRGKYSNQFPLTASSGIVSVGDIAKVCGTTTSPTTTSPTTTSPTTSHS